MTIGKALAWVTLATLAAIAPASAAMSVDALRTEYAVDPVAVDAPHPRLSWVLTESDAAVRGQRQSAYQVRVATAVAHLDQPDLWDTGKVASDQQNQLPYAGKDVADGQRVWWQVRVWDKDGSPSDWSRPAAWGKGLPTAAWSADWIVNPAVQPSDAELPAVHFRKPFTVGGQVRRAVLYATAAGIYELSVNGHKVGHDFFAPGWTEYDKRLYYQAYDVTDQLHGGGENAIGVTLGDGWYGLHHDGRGSLAVRAVLVMTDADGTVHRVPTDATWRTSTDGPIRAADLYNGEAYDARREMPGWDSPGFDDARWAAAAAMPARDRSPGKDVTAAVRAAVKDDRLTLKATNVALGGDPSPDRHKVLRVHYTVDGTDMGTAVTRENDTLRLRGRALTVTSADYGPVGPPNVAAAALEAHPGSPVRQTAEVRPVAVLRPRPGVTVYDLGQNLTGVARLSVAAPAGTVATLRFGEMLQPDGSLYTANLRAARCTDTYTCRGGGVETWQPRFTFHGFRYVELTGLPTDPGPGAVVGVVFGSDAPFTSSFVCSDPMLNQLQRNIVWGQRGNYLEVPTDCPQRDERRGWSGDAQAFIATGTYNQDLAPFFTAWMRTYNDTQSTDGGFPDVAPHNVGQASPGWGDAGVICPWVMYQKYGDTRVLADGYPHMVRWIDYLRKNSRDLVRPSEGYGDWLSINANTPKNLIATAYFARSTELVAKIATVLGKPDDAAKYTDLHRQIVAAFDKAFVTDGRVKGETQTGYLLALGFDLLPPPQRPVAVDRLRTLVHERDNHLSVGFLGVNLLLPVLADTGDVPLAYTLLQNDTYPSWGYPIRQGATTVWERWNGWTRDKGFETVVMNSFNHYAYGSCGQWMFDGVAGIGSDGPGFAHAVIRPRLGGVTFADAMYDSIRGPVAVHWGVNGGKVQLSVVVPPNVSATVHVPARDAAAVTEGDGPAAKATGVRFVRSEPGTAVYEVGSGRYVFTADVPLVEVTPATRP